MTPGTSSGTDVQHAGRYSGRNPGILSRTVQLFVEPLLSKEEVVDAVVPFQDLRTAESSQSASASASAIASGSAAAGSFSVDQWGLFQVLTGIIATYPKKKALLHPIGASASASAPASLSSSAPSPLARSAVGASPMETTTTTATTATEIAATTSTTPTPAPTTATSAPLSAPTPPYGALAALHSSALACVDALLRGLTPEVRLRLYFLVITSCPYPSAVSFYVHLLKDEVRNAWPPAASVADGTALSLSASSVSSSVLLSLPTPRSAFVSPFVASILILKLRSFLYGDKHALRLYSGSPPSPSSASPTPHMPPQLQPHSPGPVTSFGPLGLNWVVEHADCMADLCNALLFFLLRDKRTRYLWAPLPSSASLTSASAPAFTCLSLLPSLGETVL